MSLRAPTAVEGVAIQSAFIAFQYKLQTIPLFACRQKAVFFLNPDLQKKPAVHFRY